MAIYTKSKGLRNSTVYRKDHLFIKASNVPAAVMEAFKTKTSVDDTNLDTGIKFRECIFCGEHSKHERLINGRTVYLCTEDYYAKTIGQVAEQLNKMKQA